MGTTQKKTKLYFEVLVLPIVNDGKLVVGGYTSMKIWSTPSFSINSRFFVRPNHDCPHSSAIVINIYLNLKLGCCWSILHDFLLFLAIPFFFSLINYSCVVEVNMKYIIWSDPKKIWVWLTFRFCIIHLYIYFWST